jgi:hypothetical protein
MPVVAAAPEHPTNGVGRVDLRAIGRPPIIVIGEAEPIIVPAPDIQDEQPAPAGASEDVVATLEPAEPVGVMARPGDDVGEDTWQLPPQAEPAPATKRARRRPAATRPRPVRPELEAESAEPGPAEAGRREAVSAEPASVAEPLVADAGTAVLTAESGAGPVGADEAVDLLPLVIGSEPVVTEPSATEPAAEQQAEPIASEAIDAAAAQPVPAVVPTATAPARRSHKKRPAAALAKGGPAVLAVATATPAATAKPAAKATAKPAAKAKPVSKATAKPATTASPVVVGVAHCPYCGVVLDPPPTSSRRCDECQQRIIVKRIDGRAVYLAGAALPVFTAERRRVANSARLNRDRSRWLDLASTAGAPSRAVAQLRIARASDASVAAARELYLLAVERTVRMAKRDKEWEAAARLRRDEATTIYRAEGSPKPPSAEVVELYREGVAAELRGIAEISRDAQLVAATCCEACRADDEVVIRIASELRQPRLPHADCPKGLCRCHWDLAARDRTTLLRYLRRRPASASRATSTETSPSR